MFVGALNHFVWCPGASKADFFDLCLREMMEVSWSFFIYFFLYGGGEYALFGIKRAKKKSYQTSNLQQNC